MTYTPVWVIQVGIIQDMYRDGEITYEEAVDQLKALGDIPDGCFKRLEAIRDE